MRYFTSCCLISLALFSTPTFKDLSSATSAASLHSPSPPSLNSPKDWQIGVQMWTFHFVSFVKALDKAVSAGVKYLEAFPGQTLCGGMPGSFGIGMTDSTREMVKQLLQSRGIHIYAMGVITPRTIEDWKKYFDLAKYF